VAQWLVTEGFRQVSILEGGLAAWRAAGLQLAGLRPETPARAGSEDTAVGRSLEEARASFLPSLAHRYLLDGGLPARRRLTTLFVDLAGSTRFLLGASPERALGVVQRFMRLVTDVALAYCGDVKDFEGDGALLYFESTAEAGQAALAIRAALRQGACDTCPDPEGRLVARMSLTVGDVVLGVIGTSMRQAIALVGPSVSVGARLLKEVAPGGIIASGEVVDALRRELPSLANEFRLLSPAFLVPGTEGLTVAAHVID
jgi:class 3 adenylate cyclase